MSCLFFWLLPASCREAALLFLHQAVRISASPPALLQAFALFTVRCVSLVLQLSEPQSVSFCLFVLSPLIINTKSGYGARLPQRALCTIDFLWSLTLDTPSHPPSQSDNTLSLCLFVLFWFVTQLTSKFWMPDQDTKSTLWPWNHCSKLYYQHFKTTVSQLHTNI